MPSEKRVFIFGAGFSKPAEMPLATDLLPLLANKLKSDEMQKWLDSLRERLDWLTGSYQLAGSFKMNIEEVFHYAYFDVEAHRLMQHLARVGRHDGPDTPWNHSESISSWLSYLEEALCDVILESEDQAKLAPIIRWAENVQTHDSVVTFNYDTLVERSLATSGKGWNHGISRKLGDGIAVCKLHGSIDWIVAHRSRSFFKGLDLLFDKENMNRSEEHTGHREEDYRLWRCRERDQLKNWISGRDLQSDSWKSVGIAGLGAYKQTHEIPGLGLVWANGMQALYEADSAIVVGFSMSNFDAMAQMQFAEVARKREAEGRPLRVRVIDPHIQQAGEERFQHVFRHVEFEKTPHQEFDWAQC